MCICWKFSFIFGQGQAERPSISSKAKNMAVRSRFLSQTRGSMLLTFLVTVSLILTDGVASATSGPTDGEKIQRLATMFRYAMDGDILNFQAGFADDALYQYSGGPGLPYTGPFKGQDSCVRALETYSTLFNFTLRSFDIAISPSSGKAITQVDVGLKGLETGVVVNENCFLYITLNDSLLVTEIVESCNSLAEFVALQSKSCAKKIQECANQHDQIAE
ncbi:hypothetical protein KFL_000030750 [Klebsormidium nitens]|uniref:SnoaL-like domain-containing protein n=1 Tax=Klebsormidium nitens TaxID=105231 RepID=A0A1Y1HPP5_KLENI|nr:hypothetical protein KFL_000030750 [Klebsormidium nitens]|eukprot:GAQ77798.1 hypothetical protein KFL_000030750 [Klebsormidium nitens]